jgi:hypothetical protein
VATFSGECWVVLGLIALGAILAIFGRVAAVIEDGKRRHDRDVSAERLRISYAAQLVAQQKDEGVIEVDAVPEEPEKVAA